MVQAGTPLLFLLVSIPEALTSVWRVVMRAICWPAIALLSVFIAANLSPIIVASLPDAAKYQWCDVEGERLYAPDYSCQFYEAALSVVQKFQPGQSCAIVPYEPGLYAVFRLRCPIYESYPLFPASPSEQKEVVEDLSRPGMDWVMAWPERVDGRVDLGFSKTDQLAWEYILKNFDLVGIDHDAAQCEHLSPQNRRGRQLILARAIESTDSINHTRLFLRR